MLTFSLSFRPPESLETLRFMLTQVDGVPAYLPNCLLLQDTVNRAKEWLQEAEDLQVECSTLYELCSLYAFHMLVYQSHVRVFEGLSVCSVNGSLCDYLCLCWQVGGQTPVLCSLSDMVLRAHAIPVRLEPLDQLEVLVSEVQAWKESAAKTFLIKNSPFTLLEVRLLISY